MLCPALSSDIWTHIAGFGTSLLCPTVARIRPLNKTTAAAPMDTAFNLKELAAFADCSEEAMYRELRTPRKTHNIADKYTDDDVNAFKDLRFEVVTVGGVTLAATAPSWDGDGAFAVSLPDDTSIHPKEVQRITVFHRNAEHQSQVIYEQHDPNKKYRSPYVDHGKGLSMCPSVSQEFSVVGGAEDEGYDDYEDEEGEEEGDKTTSSVSVHIDNVVNYCEAGENEGCTRRENFALFHCFADRPVATAFTDEYALVVFVNDGNTEQLVVCTSPEITIDQESAFPYGYRTMHERARISVALPTPPVVRWEAKEKDKSENKGDVVQRRSKRRQVEEINADVRIMVVSKVTKKVAVISHVGKRRFGVSEDADVDGGNKSSDRSFTPDETLQCVPLTHDYPLLKYNKSLFFNLSLCEVGEDQMETNGEDNEARQFKVVLAPTRYNDCDGYMEPPMSLAETLLAFHAATA